MTPSSALVLHVAVGTVALAAFWGAFAARKGGTWHRRSGRVFFVAMLAVVGTVAPLTVAEAPVEPARIVQLVYLSACVACVVSLAWTSVRWRRAPERFARLPLRAAGATLTALGGLVLAAGLATGNPVAVVLSWVGLAFGTAMWRHARTVAPLPTRWWLQWHLDAVCGLLTAVHGTMLFVAWRAVVAPDAGPASAAGAHLLVLGVALGVRARLGRQHEAPSFVFPSLPARDGGGLLPARGR